MNPYVIILALVSLGGIAITIWGWRVLRISQMRKKWPSVEGVITASESSSEDDDLLPRIVFSYEVEGQVFSRVFEFPSGTQPLPEFTQAYLKKYPVDAKVRVYYDPRYPDEATLEPGTQADWMILVLGLLMAVGGAAAIIFN